jgi:uncharacterized protein
MKGIKRWIRRFLLVVLMCTLWALFEATQIQVKHYKLDHPGLTGLKIVFLSDFHYSKQANGYKLKQVIEKSNHLEPDLVILGGDYSNGTLNDLDQLFESLGQLEAKLGIYVVSGNHDYEPGYQMKLQKLIQFYGFKNLNQRGYWLNYKNERFKLIGVGDRTHELVNLSKDLSDTGETDYVMLISHQPDLILDLTDEELKRIDLMLSGHTHGGQVTFFGVYAPYLPASDSLRTGMKKKGDTRLIISNGIGEQLLPMRFFAPPQIVYLKYQ